MSWKGVNKENQTEIRTEKCASMHCFLCMLYGMNTVTLAQKVFSGAAYALEWKRMPRSDRLEVQTNPLPLSKLRYWTASEMWSARIWDSPSRSAADTQFTENNKKILISECCFLLFFTSTFTAVLPSNLPRHPVSGHDKVIAKSVVPNAMGCHKAQVFCLG